MACLLVAAVTGTWLVFRVEMDRLVNPEQRIVQAGNAAAAAGVDHGGDERRFPRASVHTLILQDRADDSISAYLDAKDGAALEFDRVFFNPYTGAFLGGRNTHESIFTRANVDPLIDRLHYSLWLKSWGLSLMGVVAFVWLATSVVGLGLAWPSAWRRIRGWLPVLSARTDRGAYQSNYQVHRAIGVWCFPVLSLLAFTSFYQNMPQYVRPVVNAFSPLARQPSGRPVAEARRRHAGPRAGEPRARFPAAGRRASASIGEMDATRSSSGCPEISPRTAATGCSSTWLPATSLARRSRRTSRAGDRFLAWIFPLHTGTAFGMPGRIVIAAVGVGLVAMILTGFYVWLIKWRMRRRVSRHPGPDRPHRCDTNHRQRSVARDYNAARVRAADTRDTNGLSVRIR